MDPYKVPTGHPGQTLTTRNISGVHAPHLPAYNTTPPSQRSYGIAKESTRMTYWRGGRKGEGEDPTVFGPPIMGYPNPFQSRPVAQCVSVTVKDDTDLKKGDAMVITEDPERTDGYSLAGRYRVEDIWRKKGTDGEPDTMTLDLTRIKEKKAVPAGD